MKFLICFLFSVFAINAFANDVQVCTRVDDADDWRLTFDFSTMEVLFFDNDSTYTGEYQYTIETVEGVDVFASIDDKEAWIAKYYGDRNSENNRAELVFEKATVEFVCSPR